MDLNSVQYFSYRDILKSILESRISANSKYSLRAFARDIKISPSQLSLVLNGKKGISLLAAERIVQSLDLKPQEASVFLDLVSSVDAKSKAVRQEAIQRLSRPEPQSKTIAIDAFRIISDWYHFAILELTTVQGFVPSIEYIEKQLNISKYEAEEAVLRLERLDLLVREGDTWIQTHADVSTTFDVASEAIRKFHIQVLQKAMESISTQSVDEREIDSLIISINESDLPKYKSFVRKFHASVNQFAESKKKNRSQVYALSTQFFKLTKGDK